MAEPVILSFGAAAFAALGLKDKFSYDTLLYEAKEMFKDKPEVGLVFPMEEEKLSE